MAERDRVLAALTGVGWHKAGALCRRGRLKAHPTNGEDGWASIGLEGKGMKTFLAESAETGEKMRGTGGNGWPTEHAEGAEGAEFCLSRPGYLRTGRRGACGSVYWTPWFLCEGVERAARSLCGLCENCLSNCRGFHAEAQRARRWR